MGPVIFITGDESEAHHSHPAPPASMGPVIFITGDYRERLFLAANRIGLQWGR